MPTWPLQGRFWALRWIQTWDPKKDFWESPVTAPFFQISLGLPSAFHVLLISSLHFIPTSLRFRPIEHFHEGLHQLLLLLLLLTTTNYYYELLLVSTSTSTRTTTTTTTNYYYELLLVSTATTTASNNYY